MSMSDELPEFAPPTPAPSELIERATALVRRHPDARIRYFEDVRLVVEHLREYGDWRGWRAAQELNRCLSPLSKKTS